MAQGLKFGAGENRLHRCQYSSATFFFIDRVRMKAKSTLSEFELRS